MSTGLMFPISTGMDPHFKGENAGFQTIEVYQFWRPYAETVLRDG
jgi:hypothetical protein